MRMDSFQRLAGMATLSLILGAATVPFTVVVAQTNPLIAFAGVALGMFAVQVCYPSLVE